jgi:hypothetical protein
MNDNTKHGPSDNAPDGAPAEGCEPGTPDRPDRWRAKMRDRKEMLAYLRTADRYWVTRDGFGSEKRKTPA